MIHTQKITDDPHGRFWRYGRFYVRHYPGDGEQGGKPIPVPGKGENSWDCDDDAIHSSHGPHSTVHQAVAALVASGYRERTRYGSGPEWLPVDAQ